MLNYLSIKWKNLIVLTMFLFYYYLSLALLNTSYYIIKEIEFKFTFLNYNQTYKIKFCFMLFNWKIKIYYIKYIGSSNGLYYSHLLPCELISASIAVVAPASAVTNKLFPRCASRGPVKSACWRAANELLSGAPDTPNHNDGYTAVANELILHGVVTDNECVLCVATPAPLVFYGCDPLICQ